MNILHNPLQYHLLLVISNVNISLNYANTLKTIFFKIVVNI
jgi:hypothetical protein